jgi:hypothetical protein
MGGWAGGLDFTFMKEPGHRTQHFQCDIHYKRTIACVNVEQGTKTVIPGAESLMCLRGNGRHFSSATLSGTTILGGENFG